MKVLIGVNTTLDPLNVSYINIISKIFKCTTKEAEERLWNKQTNIAIRQSENLQQYFIEHDMILNTESRMAITGEIEDVVRKVVIVDIPDNIKYGIKQFECAEGEELVEQHRVWTEKGMEEVTY